MLDECRSKLLERSVDDLASKLNQPPRNAIFYECELAVLYALSKIGFVEYEKNCGGRTRPDLFFRTSDNQLKFIADMTAVSDRGLDMKNPVKYFIAEFDKILRKRGIDTGGFTFQFGDQIVYGASGPKAKILVPSSSECHPFILKHFRRIIKQVIHNPEKPASQKINTEFVKISITYNPKNRPGCAASHIHYQSIVPRDNNPVANRLKAKAKQLKDSGFSGNKGIILCDFGCALLESLDSLEPSEMLNLVLKDFFRKNSSIHFVAVMRIYSDPYEPSRDPRTSFRVSVNPCAPSSNRESLMEVFKDVRTLTPTAMNSISTAVQRSAGKIRWSENTCYGGWSVSENKVRISSRSLLALLSGEVDSKTFLEDHGFAESRKFGYFRTATDIFGAMKEQGRMISSIKVVPHPLRDDDWLEIEFEKLDPAISKFK